MVYLVSSNVDELVRTYPHIKLKEGYNVVAICKYFNTPTYFKIEPPNKECLMEVKGKFCNADIVRVFSCIQNECIMWSEY